MPASPATLGPFALRAKLHETIWGGNRLAELAGKDVPEGAYIGESWETELQCEVVTAPHAGKSLGALVDEFGVALLGSRAVAVYGPRFPLLTKFIDAHDKLSVQAHPNDAYAAAHEGGKLGKTEAWYILAADPGAQIVYGMAREESRAALGKAIVANALEPLLNTVAVRAGDVIFVPAGTVHAIGAGVALYELQEYSDITYRLYDYGRHQANGQPRELHVERALDVISYTPPKTITVTPRRLTPAPGASERRTLVACQYFVEQEVRLDGVYQTLDTPTSCRIVTVLRGAADVLAEGYAPLRMGLGQTVVLPANLRSVTLSGDATLICSWVPEADDPALLDWQADHEGLFPAS